MTQLPKQPIDKAIADAGLLTTVMDAKFNRHMPLYRQKAVFGETNLSIIRGAANPSDEPVKITNKILIATRKVLEA